MKCFMSALFSDFVRVGAFRVRALRLSKGQSFAGNDARRSVRPQILAAMGQGDQTFTEPCKALPTAVVNSRCLQNGFSRIVGFGVINSAELSAPNVLYKNTIRHVSQPASGRARRQGPTVLSTAEASANI